jgi:hypothetical protein
MFHNVQNPSSNSNRYFFAVENYSILENMYVHIYNFFQLIFSSTNYYCKNNLAFFLIPNSKCLFLFLTDCFSKLFYITIKCSKIFVPNCSYFFF